MSKLQANLLYRYNNHILFDGTFYTVPKAVCQIFTIRLYNIIEKLYQTIGYPMLINKELSTYIEM